MSDNSVGSATPVGALGGFAGRAGGQPPGRSPAQGQPPAPRAADSVSVVHGAAAVLRLLRERVLARTRVLLELPEDGAGPEFAAALDGEPAPVFLGRLLSAQNLMAARRAGNWQPSRVRRCLDEALRGGVEETLQLLAEDGRGDALAVQVVVEVLNEYGRRLAAVAAGAEEPPAVR